MTQKAKSFIEENIELIENGKIGALTEKLLEENSFSFALEVSKILMEIDVISAQKVLCLISNFFELNTISRIKCYDVGFGDCFLCKGFEDSGAKMLVDCGTRKGVGYIKNVVSDIANEFNSAKEKYIMISHLHSDHYNGIEKIFQESSTLKIDELYLPNYIYNGSLEILAEIIYGDKKSHLAKAAREILMIPGLFYKHFKQGAKICFLSQGAIVRNELCVFETLLPQIKHQNHHSIIDSSKVAEFCEEYKRILGYRDNDTGIVVVHLEGDHQKQLLDLLKRVDEDEEIKVSPEELKEIKKRFETRRNELSLAFQSGCMDSHKVLFLGDAKPHDVKDVCRKYGKGFYSFVKVPHHGTKAYFCNELPTARYYAIPNGEEKESWGVTALYNCLYGRNTKFICTNNSNCELWKSGCICDSRYYNNAICGVLSYYEVKV